MAGVSELTGIHNVIWTAGNDHRLLLARHFVFVSCRQIQSVLRLVVLPLNLRASGQSSIRTKGRCSSVPKKLSFLVEPTPAIAAAAAAAASSSSASISPSVPTANCKLTGNKTLLRQRQVQNARPSESRSAARPAMQTLSSITAKLPIIARLAGREQHAFVQSASSDPILHNRYLSNDGAARLARWSQTIGLAENSILKTSSRKQHGLYRAATGCRVRLSEVRGKTTVSDQSRTGSHLDVRRRARSPSATPVHRVRVPQTIQPLPSNSKASPLPNRLASRAEQFARTRTKSAPTKAVRPTLEGSPTDRVRRTSDATTSELEGQEDSVTCGPSADLSVSGSSVINIPVLGFFRSGRTSLLESLVQAQPVYSASKDVTGAGSCDGPSYYCPIVYFNDQLYQIRLIDCPTITHEFPTSTLDEWTNFRGWGLHLADLFILVFDITSSPSFQYVRALREQILLANIDVPMVIVANKIDLLKRAAPAVRQFADLPTSGGQMRRLNRNLFCRSHGNTSKGSNNSVGRLDLPQSLGFPSALPLSSAVPSGKNMVRRELAVLIKKHWKNCVLVECSAIYNFNVLSILKEVMKFVQCREAGPKPTAAQAVQAAWVRNQCSIL
ncbi:Ras-like protein member 10B [Sparganum proliferum]